MAPTDAIPPDLQKAAESLEARLTLLRAPTYKIPASEWRGLDLAIQALVPGWLSALLKNYSFAGLILEFQNHNKEYRWPTTFGFFLPVSFAQYFQSGSLYLDLIACGFLPFASEEDGNVWLLTSKDGPHGAVYLLDHSAWGGGMPNRDNGLIYAHRDLPSFLSCMAVSDETFSLRPGMCMWTPLRS